MDSSRLASSTVSDSRAGGHGRGIDLHSRTTTFDRYDAFENLEQATTVVAGSDQVDVFTYQNDTTNWLIGLMKTRTARRRARDPTTTARPASSAWTTTRTAISGTRLIQPDIPTDDRELHLHSTIVYGAFGNVSSVTHHDANGEVRTTSFTYDSLDLYPATSTNALGHTTSVTVHTGLGVALDSRDANGVIPATMKYDRFGRLREVNQADGYFERYTSEGPLIGRTTVPDGNGGTMVRDEIRDRHPRPTDPPHLFDEHQSAVVTVYDRLGRVSQISRPHPNLTPPIYYTTYTYDDLMAAHHCCARWGDHAKRVHRPRDAQLRRRERAQLHRGAPRGRMALASKTIPAPRTGSRPGSTTARSACFAAPPQRTRRRRHGVRPPGPAHPARDPSTGTTTTVYNAFGELRHEINGRESRPTSRSGTAEADQLSRRVDDVQWDKPGGLGKLDVSTQQDDANGHYVITRFSYDDIGRNIKTSWEIDGNQNFFEVKVDFDTSADWEHHLAEASLRTRGTVARALQGRLRVQPGRLSSCRHRRRDRVPYWTADMREPDGQIVQRRTATASSGCASTNRRRGCSTR